MSKLQTFLDDIRLGWNRFFFSPVDLYGVGLFRLALGMTFLGMYAIRATNFSYFYLDSGHVTFSWAQKLLPMGYGSAFPFYIASDLAIQIQGVAHYVLLILFTLGLIGRNLTWLLWILNLGLMQRNMTIVYGADLFGNCWLFYLSMIQHDRYFSVKNLFKKDRFRLNLPEPVTDYFSSVGIRLIQIQACLCYGYTGIEKLKGSQWWEGTAVWYVIGMEELIPHNYAFMMDFPMTIGAMTVATVLFEVYFPFAVWNQKLKPWWLLVGFLFHLGTAMFMGLWFFCFVVTSSYLVFLNPTWLRFTVERLKSLRGRTVTA